ncbi:hypothetical protein C8F01DRAFT_469388 [Mycena amicta]|nr:hypothetical protein C8F01DRAFT_469388 [Mycena amicta]
MLALSTLLLLPSAVLSAPLFGLSFDAADSNTQSASSISLAVVESSLRPAQFARVSYCSTKSITTWTCGEPCTGLGNVTFLQSGGDEGLIPLYFTQNPL